MNRILAIDPGTSATAFVILEEEKVLNYGWIPNGEMLEFLRSADLNGCIWGSEMIQNLGMCVGREVFETCKFIGRIEEIAYDKGKSCHMIYRKDVKMHLCQSMRAKDANIRQALLDLWGGKEKAIGNKKNPGPLYGLKSHTWAALAIAVYMRDTMASDS